MPASGEASTNQPVIHPTANRHPIMSITLTLPDRESTLAFHRQRWAEVLADPEMAVYPGRIETNAFGQVTMSPPAAESHSDRQGEVVYQLRRLLGGRAKPECPVGTSDGVKAIDVGWYSASRHSQVQGQIACDIAPEICVEVISPSNTVAEMEFKRALYFEAGAIECWQCGLQGEMTYYRPNDPNTPQTHSTLCPNFPAKISD